MNFSGDCVLAEPEQPEMLQVEQSQQIQPSQEVLGIPNMNVRSVFELRSSNSSVSDEEIY